ncbi:MAG: beta-lactamase family protein, partial [Phycisphaerales bacterium]|nr:beta-lactamase family protein [Phycisphaerales bacterium]
MKRAIYSVLASGALLAVAHSAAAQGAGTAPAKATAAAPRTPVDLSERLATIREKLDVPGIAVVMIDRHGALARGVTGVRRAGGTTPVTLDDRWHLGSCTKAMTGTLCALLVNDASTGLRWDSTIEEVFNPKRDEKAKIANNWRLATLRDLTTCTANVPGDLGEYGGRPLWKYLWEKASQKLPAQEQRAFLLNELVKSNISPPAHGFQYANASVALAGHMAETAAGAPFEQLIQERLFRPLGITSAGFGAPGRATADGEPEDQPWGHTSRGDAVAPGLRADNPDAIAPAGKAYMTIEDWGRFARLHLIGAEISLPRPVVFEADDPEPAWDPAETLGLSPADFAVLHGQGYDRNNDYAAGWIVTSRPAWAKGDQPGATGRCLTHVGSNTM